MIGASRRSISSVVRSTQFLSSSLQSLSNSRSVNGSEPKFSARWFSMLNAPNDKFASNLCKRNIIFISSRFDSTAAAVDSSNLTGEKYEYQAEGNKLHASRELTTSSQGKSQNSIAGSVLPFRCMTTVAHLETSSVGGSTTASPDTSQPQRIKFKRLDKTAKHIMNILDKEAVEKVQADREIPDIRPGYIIQLKVEVPENKRRVSILKGIVIARRNAGLNTTFRLRRLVAGVGVESVFPLYEYAFLDQ